MLRAIDSLQRGVARSALASSRDSGRTPEYALVTGASRGLGKVFARMLASKRRHVVLVARSPDRLTALADELHNSYGVRVLPFAVDLSVPGAAQNLASQLEERAMHINLLVNNAGFGARGRFASYPEEQCVAMMGLNNGSVVELTRYLLPAMIAAGRGGIINVASTAGFQPMPNAALYAATKSFLITFSLGLAEELRPCGISVVTLCPGRLKPESATGNERFPWAYSAHTVVAREALRQIERGGGLVIPGAFNKFGVAVQRVIPHRVIPRLAGLLSR